MEDNEIQGTDNVSTEGMKVSNNGQTTTVTFDDKTTDNVINDVAEGKEATTATDNNADDAKTEPEGLTQDDIQKQQDNEQQIKADLTNKGVDFDALSAEYEKNGALSAESMETLEKAGYPKSAVETYLAGLDAISDKFVNSVYKMAGGEAEYKKLTDFVSKQSDSVIKSFNRTISGGDLGQIQLAVNGVKAQMTAAYGTSNPTIMSGGSAGVAKSGYSNTAEMTKDMSDPRYQTDPQFTRMVVEKIKLSTLF